MPGTPNAVLLCLKATRGQPEAKLVPGNTQSICYGAPQIINLFLKGLWVYTGQKQEQIT